MGIKRTGSDVAAPAKRTAPPKTTKAADAAQAETAEEQAEVVEQAAEDVAEDNKPETAVPDRIITPRERARAAAAAKPAADTAAQTEKADVEDWTLSGDDAIAKAQAENAKREAEKEERRSRGYWPREFRLIAPGTMGRDGAINDRYQADVIVLDAKMGPAFNLHRVMSRRNRLEIYEPCPKEWDSCPLCPPTGQYDSRFVQLLTVLNITGYQIKTGDRAGEYVPMSQELMIVELGNMPFFHAVMQEHGTLRGLHLTMTRNSKNDPDIGAPSFSNGAETVAEPVFHSEEQIEKFIRDNGMWQQKKTRPTPEHPNGEVIDAREDWLRHPFTYSEFLNKPSGEDLRQRYQSQGSAPLGSSGGQGGDSQWGGGRFEPGSAGPTTGAGAGGGNLPPDADLSDDEPF